MSILERIKNEDHAAGKKLFAVLTGCRLAGKTTAIGTLPGRTLLLQAAVLESGSESAKSLARESGNELYVKNFKSVGELQEILEELKKDEDFDNIAVDSVSAITEMSDRTDEVKKAKKKVVWDGFRMIGEQATDVILALKELTYPESVAKPKNTVLTCALDAKHDANGNVIEVSLTTKGQMAVSQITKVGEAVMTVLPPMPTEDGGDTGHRLITKTQDFWPGRIDGILAKDNPGMIAPADLSKVLELVGE